MAELEEEVGILRKKVELLSQTINNPPENEISPPEVQAEVDRAGVDFERKLKEQGDQIKQLSKTLDAYKATQTELERRLQRVENSSPQAYTETLTIEGFTEKKLSMESWTGPLFRNEPGLQHKLKLTMWPNGQREGKNTHVSMWLEQEDANNQPAHIYIHFELLNHICDWNHIVVNCHFPIENKYIGAISNTLVEHKALDYDQVAGTRFLEDDTLKVRIQAFIKILNNPPVW